MNETTISVFTVLGLIFCFPFLITIIENPNGFGNHETYPLIFLGMVLCGFPISIFGFIKIIKLINKEEIRSETENK